MDKFLGIIRHVLTFLAGYLVSKGIIDEGTAIELVGLLVGIIGVVWSILEKQQRTGIGRG